MFASSVNVQFTFKDFSEKLHALRHISYQYRGGGTNTARVLDVCFIPTRKIIKAISFNCLEVYQSSICFEYIYREFTGGQTNPLQQ